jgi:hypothetical protein
MDLEEEKRDCVALIEQINALEPDHPEIVEGLRRIREEERHHREEILDMPLKSDPYALPMPTPEHQQLEKQKQEWLEQQKMEWLEKRRMEWEAVGKPVPWAEWLGEREFEWATTELPNRELEWARRLAEQETAQMGSTERALSSVRGSTSG